MDQQNGCFVRRGRNARMGQLVAEACAGRKQHCAAVEQLLVLILRSHIRMMPEKRSIGNLDPSRASGLHGVADTPAGGRDDRVAPPGSVDGGSWRCVAAPSGLERDRRDCNNGVRDHTVGRSRTPPGILCRGKPAAEEPLRHVPPSVYAGGAGQRQPIHGRLEPASMRGDLLQGCQAGTRPVARPGSILIPTLR